MNKYVISYDTSNEGIPCLTIMRDSWFTFTGNSYEIINVFTGSKAVSIWHTLTQKAKEESDQS